MTKKLQDSFLDLLLSDPSTQEERNEATHAYVTTKDGYISVDEATDLGLWILYGAKDVTVATQIRLTAYKTERGVVE